MLRYTLGEKDAFFSPIEECWPANGPAVFRKNVVRTEPFWNQQHYSKDPAEKLVLGGDCPRFLLSDLRLCLQPIV